MSSLKEWLLNPFQRIAGAEALLTGLAIMLLSACIAWASNTHFDGVLDVHAGGHRLPGWMYFLEPVLAWTCALFVFFIVARIGAGSRFRLIDLAGTLALSRAPMLLTAPLGFFVPDNVDPLNPGPAVLISILPIIIVTIWVVTLMFQAFRVSVNPKGSRRVLLFVVALILAEIVSKLVFLSLYKNIAI